MSKIRRSNNYFELLWVLAKTDFKLRYQGSVLGYLWSLLKPFLMFVVLYVVFSVFMRWEIAHYQLYLLLGIIIWNFFAEGTMAGLNTFLTKSEVMKKIYFPRILIVLASTISAFISLLLNVLVFLLIYLFSGMDLHAWMLFFPVYLILIYLFVVGISLFLSVLQVKYRDVEQIWEVLLQAGFFITPIIYPLMMVPEKYWFYLFLNPVTGIIQYSRKLIIEQSLPSLSGTLYVFLFIVFVVVFGYWVFNKLSYKVIEEL
ncbi:ABC transporter permease [Candidatus Peregrinibacteria bacterium]|nr:ABC transporter permease [Candidatus Peregrinibacteria bacterium]